MLVVDLHTINAHNGATYPIGNAYVTYAVSGASYRSYWTATRPKRTNEIFINTKTSGYGIEVYTASN